MLLTISPTLGRQFETLIEISTILTLVMYGWCAVAALKIGGQAASPAAGLMLRACAGLALAFCIWTVAFSDLKLLALSLGFLGITVPLWQAVRVVERAKGRGTIRLPG